MEGNSDASGCEAADATEEKEKEKKREAKLRRVLASQTP